MILLLLLTLSMADQAADLAETVAYADADGCFESPADCGVEE